MLSVAILSFAGPACARDLYENALAAGSRYESRRDYIDRALSKNKVQIQSAWAADGISKYVTFYRDEDVLASLVADAKAQLRNITVDDLKAIPITGLLFANVDLHARGVLSKNKLERDFTDGKTRLVLKIGDQFIQPVRDGFFPSQPKTGCVETTYLWTVFGSYRFMVGGAVPVTTSCDPNGPNKFSLEFAFQLTQEQMRRKAEVFIVDGRGKKYSKQVDLSKM